MTRIIQIRGVHGTGKTTAVREFCARHNMTVEKQKTGAKAFNCTSGDGVVVIGRYDKNECGGVDAEIRSGEDLRNLVASIVRKKRPEVLLFEGVMYGHTFKFSYDISVLAKALGAGYTALCFVPPLEFAIENVYRRNGGKDVNIKAMSDKYRAGIVADAKLRAVGVNMVQVDTSKYKPEQMWELIEEQL